MKRLVIVLRFVAISFTNLFFSLDFELPIIEKKWNVSIVYCFNYCFFAISATNLDFFSSERSIMENEKFVCFFIYLSCCCRFDILTFFLGFGRDLLTLREMKTQYFFILYFHSHFSLTYFYSFTRKSKNKGQYYFKETKSVIKMKTKIILIILTISTS